jgi:hypothetical protein
MNSSGKGFDDLTVIKGIGPARQTWLRESLGVRTYADLASLSADEIQSQLIKDKPKNIPDRETIEGWIAGAKEHTAGAEHAAEPAGPVTDMEAEEHVSSSNEANDASHQPVEAARAETENDEVAKATSHKDGWKPFASFVVEFQERTLAQDTEYRTTVHHIEADTDAKWSGLSPEQFPLWMLEQVKDRISLQATKEQPPEPEKVAKPVPAATSPLKVKITQIRAFQPPGTANLIGTGQSGQPFQGLVKGHTPFALEIRFGLVGEAVAGSTKNLAVYRARAYVQDSSTGKSIQLGDTEPDTLIADKLDYTATLPDLTLIPGTYRLFALIALQATPIKPDFIVLPVFKVA